MTEASKNCFPILSYKALIFLTNGERLSTINLSTASLQVVLTPENKKVRELFSSLMNNNFIHVAFIAAKPYLNPSLDY